MSHAVATFYVGSGTPPAPVLRSSYHRSFVTLKVDPGEVFWTEEEIAEEQRLYGKDEANETLEKLFQAR